MSGSISIQLSCHCRNFTSTIVLPRTVLPLKSSICHCSICRRSTGHIFATFAVIPLSTKPICTGLTKFDSSRDITRWFCTTCGCSIWNDDRANNGWDIATGVISGITYDHKNVNSEGAQPGTISYGNPQNRGPGSPEGQHDGMHPIDGMFDRVQLWINSTGDGGGAIWLNGGHLTDTKNKTTDRKSDDIDRKTLQQMVSTARSRIAPKYGTDKKANRPQDNTHGLNPNLDSNTNLTLPIRCACDTINLTITRPTPSTRYAAGLDACWSCRTTSGVDITSWATIPSSCFTWTSNSQPVTLREDVFSMYSTSAGTRRYFCRGCGAVVLFVVEGKGAWDLGVGLVDCEALGEGNGDGVRVEGWFEWVKYGERGVAWVEDAIDGLFVAALVDGVKKDENERYVGGEDGWRVR